MLIKKTERGRGRDRDREEGNERRTGGEEKKGRKTRREVERWVSKIGWLLCTEKHIT